jgi:hypothetical protein
MPNTALDDVCTTFDTPRLRQASRSTRVPSTLTVRNSSASLASGT